MKKAFAAAALAIAVIALSQQQASAWVNAKFGVGLNWEMQSGGNSFFWGAWKNGQVPGPEAFQGGTPYQGSPAPFQYFGSAPASYVPYAGAPVPQASYDMPTAQSYAAPSVNYGTTYQFANYPRPVYYYPTPSYYYGR